MGRIFSACVDAFASMTLILPVFALCHRLVFRKGKHTALYCVFAFYLIAVMSLVGLPSVNYVRIDFSVNIIPFVDMISDMTNTLLNVLLFVPMGFFLPVLWEKCRHVKTTLILCLCITGLIEGLQILTFRTTDINDIITNTVGGVIGFGIAGRMTKGFSKLVCTGTKQCEMYIVFAVSFAVMFFGVPYISAVLWELIRKTAQHIFLNFIWPHCMFF